MILSRRPSGKTCKHSADAPAPRKAEGLRAFVPRGALAGVGWDWCKCFGCMLLEANDLIPGSTLTADVCIAGAGAAGIALALSLSEAGLDVVLLESGGLSDEPETQALYQGTMSGINTWKLDAHRWRLFGGSTSRWAGWCRPMESYDFEIRAHIPESGWPITLNDLIPYYQRAHQRVELGDYLWDVDDIQALSGRPLVHSPSGRMLTRVFQYSPPTRFGELYRNTLADAPNVRIYLHANLVNLELTSNLSKLSRFEVATLDGVQFNVEASAYVLALGGIENVRLLLASNSTLAAGVANSSGNVGQFFMEHPHYNGVSKLALSQATDLGFYRRHSVEMPAGEGTQRLNIMGVLALEPEVLASEGVLDFTASISEVALGPGETGDIDVDRVRSLVREGEGDRAYQLYVRAEQSPRPDSRIVLRESDRDALGLPRVDLDWKIHPDDDQNLRRGMEILGAELAAAGLGRLWTSADADRLRWTALPGGHHMGTLRMSADPEMGVVDANCRCHDVENLYIAGSAVFPTGGAPNPTLTVVALAERLAAHLAKELA